MKEVNFVIWRDEEPIELTQEYIVVAKGYPDIYDRSGALIDPAMSPEIDFKGAAYDNNGQAWFLTDKETADVEELCVFDAMGI